MITNVFINTTNSSHLTSLLSSQISLHILKLILASSCKPRCHDLFVMLRAKRVSIRSIDKFNKMVIYSWKINELKSTLVTFN